MGALMNTPGSLEDPVHWESNSNIQSLWTSRLQPPSPHKMIPITLNEALTASLCGPEYSAGKGVRSPIVKVV